MFSLWLKEKLDLEADPEASVGGFAAFLLFTALLVLLVPGLLLALVGTFIWACVKGIVAPLTLVLKVMFWGLIAYGAAFLLGVIAEVWWELVKERRQEKGVSLTMREVLGKTLDFERWCT